MEHLQSQDGHPFIRAVAQYIRQHEKALANSLQMTAHHRKPATSATPATPTNPSTPAPVSTSTTLAAALSFAGLSFRSNVVKSAQLTLTPHHLFYLLSQIEELDIDVGPMSMRIESIHNDSSPANYISFLQSHTKPKGRSETDSIHSVSSVRSVMSGMSAFFSGMGLSNASKSEKARLALENDMKYIYGAFTKLPSLRLTPDHRTPLVKGYEQFPFDTAVPLFAFKNLQQLEIIDLDFRSFHGWDRLADQLCLLTIKRGKIDDPIDLLENIVLDDTEKRRRRSNRSQVNPPSTPSWSVPSTPRAGYARSQSDPESPQHTSPGTSLLDEPHRGDHGIETTPVKSKLRRSYTTAVGTSPKRPTPRRPTTSYRHARSYSMKAKRSGSGGSTSSDNLAAPTWDDAIAHVAHNVLPASKWQRLVYLSLADNGLTSLSERSIQPLVPSLRSFNLSSNLFTEIPDSLARLSRLVSLDLSNCMIDSLQTLVTHPLPAISTLKLKCNRLPSLAGIERLPALENLHIQGNKISDPDEAARLSRLPSFRRLWIKHNPLTKSFPDYRVRIMNHFRKAPGFIDDIIIDDQAATYYERKLLVDRTTEIERSPLAPPASEESRVIILQEASKSHQQIFEATDRLSVVTAIQHGSSTTSTKRKKSSKRRIVDLAKDDPELPAEHSFTNGPYLSGITSNTTPSVQPLAMEEHKVLSPNFSTSPTPVLEDEMVQTLTNNSQSGDEYRRNMEDLRAKFGNNWLSALSEQQGDSDWRSNNGLSTLSTLQPTLPHPPKLHHYHSTPPVIHAGGDSP